jgi:hypothetical protein
LADNGDVTYEEAGGDQQSVVGPSLYGFGKLFEADGKRSANSPRHCPSDPQAQDAARSSMSGVVLLTHGGVGEVAVEVVEVGRAELLELEPRR